MARSKIAYVGIFIEGNEVFKAEEHALKKRLNNIHVTLAFRPNDLEPFMTLLGKEVKLLVTGYGYNEENSGFSVKLPDEIMIINQNKAIPHITTSISEKGKPVNTKNLDFIPIKPFEIKGRIGFYTFNGSLYGV